MKQVYRAALGLLLARWIAGCGGALDDNTPTPDEVPDAAAKDAGESPLDATSTPDATTLDAVVDTARPDTFAPDTSPESSAGDGQALDVESGDGALPPLDASEPDANRCASGITPRLYILSSQGELVGFDPLTGTTTTFGFPCGQNQHPYGLQMTAAADGSLYVLFSDATIRQVNPVQGSSTCTNVGFDGHQQGFDNGFALAGALDGRIFIANYKTLGVMSPSTFQVAEVGSVQPPLQVNGLDLTFDAAGRLFAYSLEVNVDPDGGTFIGGTYITEIDPTTGTRVAEDHLSLVAGNAWAFTRWEQDFYLFVQKPNSAAWRYTLGSAGPTKVVDLPFDVYGAASVRCIP